MQQNLQHTGKLSNGLYDTTLWHVLVYREPFSRCHTNHKSHKKRHTCNIHNIMWNTVPNYKASVDTQDAKYLLNTGQGSMPFVKGY
jgi:hypothetical protein